MDTFATCPQPYDWTQNQLASSSCLPVTHLFFTLSAGEMIVAPKKALFMDEISTGLDSSTTFQIIKCLRDFAHLRLATVFISLLQPPPEVYKLFDDVLLLSEGKCQHHPCLPHHDKLEKTSCVIFCSCLPVTS